MNVRPLSPDGNARPLSQDVNVRPPLATRYEREKVALVQVSEKGLGLWVITEDRCKTPRPPGCRMRNGDELDPVSSVCCLSPPLSDVPLHAEVLLWADACFRWSVRVIRHWQWGEGEFAGTHLWNDFVYRPIG